MYLFKITLARDPLLAAVARVLGAVDRKQTLPILGHVLIRTADRPGIVELIATDLEMELRTETEAHVDVPGEVTIPARRLFEVVKSLPEGGDVILQAEGQTLTLKCGRIRFQLATLAATDFPVLSDLRPDHVLTVPQRELLGLIKRTAFAMAQQDVRYYLNGLLLELTPTLLKSVATDGHRLAVCEWPHRQDESPALQAIVPRKAVLELERMLEDSERGVEIGLESHHVRFRTEDRQLTSKIIDGRFPDYQRVIPRGCVLQLQLEREEIRGALARAIILASDKLKGVRMICEPGRVVVEMKGEQEDSREELPAQFNGQQVLEISFNIGYLRDLIQVLEDEHVTLQMQDAFSGVLVERGGEAGCRYVVMPMRL